MNFTRKIARALENLTKKSHDLVKMHRELQIRPSFFNRAILIKAQIRNCQLT